MRHFLFELLRPNRAVHCRSFGPWDACTVCSVLNVVCGIEGIDMQLMPASFKALQSDFHWALQDLGSLVFYQESLLIPLFHFSWSWAMCALREAVVLFTTSTGVVRHG